jgi:hypothetical protein
MSPCRRFARAPGLGAAAEARTGADKLLSRQVEHLNTTSDKSLLDMREAPPCGSTCGQQITLSAASP